MSGIVTKKPTEHYLGKILDSPKHAQKLAHKILQATKINKESFSREGAPNLNEIGPIWNPLFLLEHLSLAEGQERQNCSENCVENVYKAIANYADRIICFINTVIDLQCDGLQISQNSKKFVIDTNEGEFSKEINQLGRAIYKFNGSLGLKFESKWELATAQDNGTNIGGWQVGSMIHSTSLEKADTKIMCELGRRPGDDAMHTKLFALHQSRLLLDKVSHDQDEKHTKMFDITKAETFIQE